jgi:hypothetical protein
MPQPGYLAALALMALVLLVVLVTQMRRLLAAPEYAEQSPSDSLS